MRGQRSPRSDRDAKPFFSVQPRTFVFFDKTTHTHRFEVKAQADGSMPAHEAASLLAMHCVMRGQTPKDFGVMVGVDANLLNGLERRAQKLINACVTLHFDVQLSQRQHQVLRGVLQNLTNKEIAAQLQIGVRTVKFHVSSLLGKFGVTDRLSLAQKTGGLMSGGSPSAKLAIFQPSNRKDSERPNSRHTRPPLTLNVLTRRSGEPRNVIDQAARGRRESA